MEKEILNELKRLNGKMDTLIEVLSNSREAPMHNKINHSTASRGDDIRRQVQEQIAQARREISSNMNKMDFPIGNIE